MSFDVEIQGNSEIAGKQKKQLQSKVEEIFMGNISKTVGTAQVSQEILGTQNITS